MTLLWRYGLVALAVGLAVVLTMLLPTLLSRTVYVLFFAAVMISSWYGGAWPGRLAILLSALAGIYIVLPPAFVFRIDVEGLVQTSAFVLVALLINGLTAALQQSQAALTQANQSLEQQVDQRTALTQLLQEITAAANEAKTEEAALRFMLERVCAYLNWPVAHVYLLAEEDPKKLTPSPIWYLAEPERFERFRQATEANHFPSGVGLPGQVLANGQLLWLGDLTQKAVFHRAQAAVGDGLKAGFGFPIWAGEDMVAVAEFFSLTAIKPDGPFLELVTQIGTQVGRVVERKRAEKQIQESRQELVEAQQIAHLGSWQWHIATNTITWSDEMYRIYGLEPQSLKITFEGFLARVHPDDRQLVSALVTHAYQTGQPFSFEHRVTRPDGLIRTLHAQGKVFMDTAGHPLRMAGTGHDITDFKVEQAARLEAEAGQQRLALLAEMRERNRLAQELHDTVAQALGYLNLKIAVAHTLLVEERMKEATATLEELKQVIGQTYTDVREEILYLRARTLPDLSFKELLGRYIDKYCRFYNLDIHLIQEADPALFNFPAEVTSQLIRTVQEALINVRKHAQTNAVTIRLGQENEHLWISVEDHGQGFDPVRIQDKTTSFGLQMMHERLESVDGTLEVDTAPGQGTRIKLRYKRPS